MRGQLIGMVLGLLIQFALGITVNLYVAVPAHHSGAHPSNFLTGSARSIVWAIAHSRATLAAHAVWGLLLVLNALGLLASSLRLRQRALVLATGAGGLFVVAAGFNGAAFLDYGHDGNSLAMALLLAAALLAYVLALDALARAHPVAGAQAAGSRPRAG